VPTLLLTPRSTDDAQELWRGWARLRWSVHRVHGWKVPAVDPTDVAIYAEPFLATYIARTLKLKLLEPEVDWLPSLPERWRNRTVLLSTMEEARAVSEPRFIKSAAGKEFDARIYSSGKDLPRGELIKGSLAVSWTPSALHVRCQAGACLEAGCQGARRFGLSLELQLVSHN